MPLIGSLREADVTALIELACQSREPARIQINSGGATRVLYTVDGELVHAEHGKETGPSVVFAALEQVEGTFELEKGVGPPDRVTIDLPWKTLLLQGLQRLDESSQSDQPDNYRKEKTEMAAKEKAEDVLTEMANDLEPGLRGAAIAGMDGLGIAFHKVGGEVADNLGSQMALIMQLSRRAAERMEKSDVEDVLVTSDKSYILGRFLGDNSYFLVVSVERDAVLGNVRLAMRNYTDRLLKAIP